MVDVEKNPIITYIPTTLASPHRRLITHKHSPHRTMADETDFFTPPADDSEAFFAVPHPGDDPQNIGDVYYGTDSGGDFFNPPDGGGGDAPIVLGGGDYGDDDDGMGFAGAPYDPPPPAPVGVVEAVDSDDEATLPARGRWA